MIQGVVAVFLIVFVIAYVFANYKVDSNDKLAYKKSFDDYIKEYPNILALLEDPIFFDKVRSQVDEQSDLGVIIEKFIQFGADVNVKDASGVPALFKYKLPIVRILLAAGADPNIRNGSGESILMLKDGADTELVQALIEAGADLHAKDEGGKTVLMHATPQMTDLLLKHSILVDDVDVDGCSALHHSDNPTKTFLLIKAGANVDLEDFAGNTPILSVKEARSAELLMDAGADLTKKNNAGKTVLMTPGVASREVFVKAINDGVDVNAAFVDGDGVSHTTLMVIMMMPEASLSRETRLERVEALIRAKADVNAKNNRGQTALMFARDASLVRRLIMVGADVSMVDDEGNTPLMFAESRECVEALVQAGVPVNATNKVGRTALMVARNTSVAEALLELGADKNIAMPSGLIAEDLVKDDLVKNVIKQWAK